jgi:hypothetical protein
MSFTSEVKEELARVIPSRPCCRKAELSALLHMEGTLHLWGTNRVSLHTESETAAVARKIFTYLKEFYHLHAEIRVEKAPRLRGHNCYLLYLGEDGRVMQALNELGIVDDALQPVLGIPRRMVRRPCCGSAYLRGAFLGGGYISRPGSAAHLEITVQHLRMAEDLADLLLSRSLHFQVTRRKEHYVVYGKGRREQVELMALLGAYNIVLRLENEAVLRDLREKVNRRVNSETANLERMARAATRQVRDIEKIDRLMGVTNLPPALREIALLRLLHPEASMRELGEMTDPPLSKSAVYHRLLRLRRISERL